MIDTVELPEMRAEVVEALRARSDPAHQQVRWASTCPALAAVKQMQTHVSLTARRSECDVRNQ